MDENLLESWNEAIVKPGARILWNRMRYVEQMKQELPQGLFGSEALKMHYVSTVTTENHDVPAIEECFRQHLFKARSGDQKTGYTSVGPHRDDLKLYVNGKSLVDFGSSGQQRSCLLSLYFSQMEIHRKTHGFYPLFLVDDAEAELDTQRIEALSAIFVPANTDFFDVGKRFSPLLNPGANDPFCSAKR